MTAVVVRSYSRMIGQTSLEQKTGSSGAIRPSHGLCGVLVRRVAVRVDEGDRDALGTERPRLRHRGLDVRLVHGKIPPHRRRSCVRGSG